MSFDETDPKSIADQLRCPRGMAGIETAEKMNRNNRTTNSVVFAELEVKDGDSILEIGPGNGGLLSTLLAGKSVTRYVGVDWSHDMVDEARRINRNLKEATFIQGSSESLPFEGGAFSKAFSVHTIYFWERLDTHLQEIARVLEPEGRFVLCFGDEAFVRSLPFVRYGFELYAVSDVVSRLEAVGFEVTRILRHEETGQSNAGSSVKKTIQVLICDKDALTR
ncbi:MAG: class I SAM-dependent methyltransferase [Planctomycetota bacterium]